MKRGIGRWEIAFVALVFAAGLALRLRLAIVTSLNPDEALHALISFGPWAEALRNSLTVTHPPLLIMITHAVSMVSHTDLAVRLIPVLSGSLFPLLLFFWLRRVAGTVAAMTALFLLTMAPNLISLSAQVRSYTLALLFLSACLLVLEMALDLGRWQIMAAYSVLVWLCILSDYSMAWFAGAAGVYALLRLRGAPAPVKTTWAVGQLAALAIYAILFAVQVRQFRGSVIEYQAWTGWLTSAFPARGNMLVFPFVNTLKQFAYLMASVPLGALASILFALAVVLLWTGRTGIDRDKARALAVLLVLPFLMAIAGAYAHQFPYGRTRHSVVLGVGIAIGIGILVGTLPRPAGIAAVWTMFLLAPVWLWTAAPDAQNMSPERNRKALLFQAFDYMQANIPPGSLIFTEGETFLQLAFYQGGRAPTWVDGKFTEVPIGGWRVAVRDYGYTTHDEYAAGLAAFRRDYGLSPGEPVWVLDGGWEIPSGPADAKHPFTRAMRVFEDAPGR